MKLSKLLKSHAEKPVRDIERIETANELAGGDKELAAFIEKRIKRTK